METAYYQDKCSLGVLQCHKKRDIYLQVITDAPLFWKKSLYDTKHYKAKGQGVIALAWKTYDMDWLNNDDADDKDPYSKTGIEKCNYTRC